MYNNLLQINRWMTYIMTEMLAAQNYWATAFEIIIASIPDNCAPWKYSSPIGLPRTANEDFDNLNFYKNKRTLFNICSTQNVEAEVSERITYSVEVIC